MRIIIALGLLALAVSPADARKKDGARDTKDPDEVICKYSDEIGTRLMRKKTCLTRSQWSQMQEELRRTVQRVQDYKPAQQ